MWINYWPLINDLDLRLSKNGGNFLHLFSYLSLFLLALLNYLLLRLDKVISSLVSFELLDEC